MRKRRKRFSWRRIRKNKIIQKPARREKENGGVEKREREGYHMGGEESEREALKERGEGDYSEGRTK